MSKQGTKKWVMFALRWGIAIAGVTWVVYNLHFHDRVKVLTEANTLADMRVLGYPPEDAADFRVWGAMTPGAAPAEHVVRREQVWTNRSDRSTVAYRAADGTVRGANVAGIRPADTSSLAVPPKLLVEDPATKAREVIDPSQVVGKYQAPRYPLIEIGLIRMARTTSESGNWWYLLAALALMPASYLLTSYRWYLLLETADIHVGQARTFVINMVGAFYNTFMPGSTGGDVVKAYYVSKHTEHRTRAVMSVLVDRAMGLLALVILGGAMAAFQYNESLDCRRVAKVSGLLVLVTVVGLVVFYHRGLRRATGLRWLLRRLPMQRFVQKAVHTMELYGRRPSTMLVAILLCFPVHITSILSASMAGKAFGLEVPPMYYWVVIPVIALVGAIPISPQGAGVMEFFAIKLLTVRHPVSVGQAVALVLSIRLVQMFWNLVAGLFVLRGGYHAPTAAEQHELEEAVDEDAGGDDELGEDAAPAAPAPAATSNLSSMAGPAPVAGA